MTTIWYQAFGTSVIISEVEVIKETAKKVFTNGHACSEFWVLKLSKDYAVFKTREEAKTWLFCYTQARVVAAEHALTIAKQKMVKALEL